MTNAVQTELIRNKQKLSRSISNTATKYASIKTQMHQDACSSLAWAFTHNCTSMLNKMFNALTENYKVAFRTWLAAHSAYETTQRNIDGNEVTTKTNWLMFRQSAGFAIVSGPASLAERKRLAKKYAGEETTMTVTPFYVSGDKDQTGGQLDAIALMAKIQKALETNYTKAQKTDITFPSDVSKAMSLLSKLIKRDTVRLEELAIQQEIDAETKDKADKAQASKDKATLKDSKALVKSVEPSVAAAYSGSGTPEHVVHKPV